MEFTYGVPGNPGGRGKMRGKNISSYLKDLLEEQHKDTGQPRSKLIAKRLVELAIDDKTSAREFLAFVQEIMNRLEGRPVETTLNANMEYNPLADVDTETLIQLRNKLEQMKIEQTKPL